MGPILKSSRSSIDSRSLIVLSALFVTAFANLAFFRNFLAIYHAQPSLTSHFLSVGLLLFAMLLLVLALICWPGVQRTILSITFIVSAMAAYFMDTYNVVIDGEMIANVMATDPREVADLFAPRLLAYLFVIGIVPSALVWWVRISPEKPGRAVINRLVLAAAAFLLAVALVFSSTAFYSTYLRENKTLRYYANPLTPLYAFVKTALRRAEVPSGSLRRLGLDAAIPESDVARELVVLVVGETARADRFSLNGYIRDTNPELSRLDVISFSNVAACGTSTVVSLPCMFSLQNRTEFDKDQFQRSENTLDVLEHAGVNILWRDNNSDSKGVATRVPVEDFRSAEINPDCDLECRDEGMLSGLQDFINAHPLGDILIVLHQMGSHGPAYFRRYPTSFERFKPACNSPSLDSCTKMQIGNSYDNTILYTDHFLAKVIEVLKRNDDDFETILFYVSDHGESLGESNIYLHGYPYAFAPEEQKQVPMIMWFGRNYDDVDPDALKALRSRQWSHDNVSHTLLGLFEIDSEIYQPSKDILQISKNILRPYKTGP